MGPRWHLVDSQWESVGGTLVLEKAWYRMQSGNVVVGAAVCTRLCLSALHARAHVCSWPRKPLSVCSVLQRFILTLTAPRLKPNPSPRVRKQTDPSPEQDMV